MLQTKKTANILPVFVNIFIASYTGYSYLKKEPVLNLFRLII